MIAADDVRAALRADQVLDHYGIKHSGRTQMRVAECPRCRKKQLRQAVVINPKTGKWVHHSGSQACHAPCRGDLLDLVAAYEGLDCKRDFRNVIAAAARIAGLGDSIDDAERKRLRAEREREQLEYEQALAYERDRMRHAIAGRWECLEQYDPAGVEYLMSRGLAGGEALKRVRFTGKGWPTLPLRDLSTGDIVGLESRRIFGEPKIHTEKGSQKAGAAIGGQLIDLDPHGVDVAVIVEGLADTLAAYLAFAGSAIFGAPGAEFIGAVAAAVAPRVRECRGWLLLVSDDDQQGIDGVVKAIAVAQRAGLVLDRDLHLVDLGAHHDLADAWAAGWRYSWPEIPA